MKDVKIDGINDISVVKELFSSVKCLEDDNCFLVVLNRDYVAPSIDNSSTLKNSSTVAGAKLGGVAGGVIGGAVANSINSAVEEAVSEFYSKLNDKQKIIFSRNVYCGFLINIVSNGIGIIPLKNSGQLIPNIKDFITDIDNYVFIDNKEIEKVEIQKLPLRFSVKKLAIYFKDLDNACTPWTLPIKHKLVSYQEENYNKLVNKLK